LRPVGYSNGTTWNGQARTYFIPSTDGNAYAIGDPVVLAGSADGNGIPSVILATAGAGATNLLGAIIGVGGTTYGGPSADPANIDTIILPATKTKGYYVRVADDPFLEFLIQDDGSATLAATDVSTNFILASGTNNGYVSGWTLAANSANTGATRQLQLLRLQQTPGNQLGLYAQWIVRIVTHQFNGATAGI
jgi:hypothetical protein